MNPGLRECKSATLRVAIPECVPEEMQGQMREIVSVHSTNPKKGHATVLMWDVCHEADKAGVVLILRPSKFDEGMPDSMLKGWYSKFGFVEVQADPCLMARCVKGRVLQ